MFYKRYFFLSFSLIFAMVVIQHFHTMPPITTSNFKSLSQPASGLVSDVSATTDYDGALAYISLDLNTGEVFAKKDQDRELPIASLTKLMTAVVALDLNLPNEKFTVSEHAANIEPTKMGVVPGQSWSVEELLNASLLTSANDAVEVLKEGIDQKHGSDSFVKAMNEKARFLGLKHTNFQNPQGFDGKYHYSSVADLANLTSYALKNYPLIKNIVKKDYQFYPETRDHKQADLYNWNGLMGVYPGVMGVKIGNTDDAGYTTIVVSERGNNSVLVVVLGAPGVLERDLWASELLDAGFIKLGEKPINVTEIQLKQKYSTWKYWN